MITAIESQKIAEEAIAACKALKAENDSLKAVLIVQVKNGLNFQRRVDEADGEFLSQVGARID